MSNIETPEAYDFWCAMWALGVRVGRGMHINRPHSPVFCNWYIILAAESGTTRKSTAVNSVSEMIRDHHKLLVGKTTPQALELLLHEETRDNGKAVASFAASELVTILGKESYMSTMPGLLTDLYECPAYRSSPGTLKFGEITQRDLYVNLLSAYTPSWLITAINPSVIEGGFTSRVMFVIENKRKKLIAWPKPRLEEDRINLIESFKKLNEYGKPIEISDKGLKRYTNWYNNREEYGDSFMSSFSAREDDHVLRAACCLCINDGILEIQTRHITHAIQLIETVRDGGYGLFGGTFSENARISDAVTKVREVLMEAGSDGLKHSDLHKRVQNRMDSKELKVLVKVLHESGMIQVFELSRGGRVYRATKLIEKFGVVSEVLNKLN